MPDINKSDLSIKDINSNRRKLGLPPIDDVFAVARPRAHTTDGGAFAEPAHEGGASAAAGAAAGSAD